MRKLIIILILLISKNAMGQISNDSLTFKLDQYFNAITDLNNFNGNVIIAKGNTKLLDKTYNIKNAPDSLRVSRNSKLIIASVSKVFIKFSILKLVEQKKINLRDKLSKFISDFPNSEKITIEELMYHKSGLPRELTNLDRYDNLSLEKIVELAKLEKLQFEPGTQMLYSNVGYFLLHFIIDKSSSNGYLSFIQKELLNKMKLKNTAEFNSSQNIKNFAYGFNNKDGIIIASSKKSINQFETGNYYSTIDDMYSFSQQMLSGKALKPALALKMFGKDSVFFQAGGRPGYRAYFYKNLKTDITFIFLSNYSDIPIQELTAAIIDILDNKPYEIPHLINRVKINLDEPILKRYVGKYALEDDISQTFSLQVIGCKLYDVEEDGTKTEMTADTETTFFDKPNSKDGYVFIFNELTNKYELTIISTGLKLKTKRLE